MQNQVEAQFRIKSLDDRHKAGSIAIVDSNGYRRFTNQVRFLQPSRIVGNYVTLGIGMKFLNVITTDYVIRAAGLPDLSKNFIPALSGHSAY